MNLEVLHQTLRYSEDIFGFATEDERKVLQAHEAEYRELLDVMDAASEATEPLSDAEVLRFFRACRTVERHFPCAPAVPGPLTSVSVVIGLARDCIDEAARAGVHTPEGLAVREANRLIRLEEMTRG